jgi:membrane protein DedA with SNARE-associated domain
MEELIEHLSSIEQLTNLLIVSIGQVGLIALVLTVFLLGETAILIAVLLTQQGILRWEEVLIAATIGTLAADIFWFTIGRYHPSSLVPKTMRKYIVKRTSTALTRIIGTRLFLAMLLLRFFIGTRLIIILYVSRYRISWVRFLLYDLVGTFIYIMIFTIAGTFLGQAIHDLFPSYQTIVSILSAVLLISIFSYSTKQVVRSHFLDEKHTKTH